MYLNVNIIYFFLYIQVVERSSKFRSESREASIRVYFYGSPRNVLHPHTCEVRFSDIKVYRIGAPPIPNTLMPLDMQKTDLETKLEPVTPGKLLVVY